jgi:hypothetical protein
MKVTTIAISYNRKFNLGNYNSVELSCAIWAQIDKEEDEETCIMILRDKCREHVRQEYHKAKNGSDPVELFSINGGLEPAEEIEE